VHHVAWDVPLHRTAARWEARSGVAFIGSYDHAPNRDAARWLVESVMPLVWRDQPEVRCLLVGSGMPHAVRDLARPGVEALGQVDDLAASVFDRVRLTAAPLRFGAGLKGKVLDSLAAGVPCAMSEVAAEGMLLPSELRGLVGRDAPALAALVCRLHQDLTAHHALAEAGASWIGRTFGADTIAAGLRSAIERRVPVRTAGWR
jgi:glycosyltransferase involved in cell wall biosynthesis